MYLLHVIYMIMRVHIVVYIKVFKERNKNATFARNHSQALYLRLSKIYLQILYELFHWLLSI